jgi:hypothetical protein
VRCRTSLTGVRCSPVTNGRRLKWPNGKAGSDSDANARDAAIIASISLQYGVPLEVIRHALLRDPRGNASTPLGVALDAIGGSTP